MENYVLLLLTKASAEIRKLVVEKDVVEVKESIQPLGRAETRAAQSFPYKNYKQTNVARAFQASVNS